MRRANYNRIRFAKKKQFLEVVTDTFLGMGVYFLRGIHFIDDSVGISLTVTIY